MSWSVSLLVLSAFKKARRGDDFSVVVSPQLQSRAAGRQASWPFGFGKRAGQDIRKKPASWLCKWPDFLVLCCASGIEEK